MEETTSVNTTPAAEPEIVAPTLTPEEDLEAKFTALEAEKNKAIEEAANWKVAALKAKSKQSVDNEDETEEERIARVANRVLADSRVVQLAQEQDALLQKAFKENKELKLAQLNKTNVAPPAAVGSHSEATPVRDTLITPDQMAAFKAKGWSDKDIERYKKNLQRYAR